MMNANTEKRFLAHVEDIYQRKQLARKRQGHNHDHRGLVNHEELRNSMLSSRKSYVEFYQEEQYSYNKNIMRAQSLIRSKTVTNCHEEKCEEDDHFQTCDADGQDSFKSDSFGGGDMDDEEFDKSDGDGMKFSQSITDADAAPHHARNASGSKDNAKSNIERQRLIDVTDISDKQVSVVEMNVQDVNESDNDDNNIPEDWKPLQVIEDT